MDTIMFGLPLGDFAAALAVTFGAWVIVYMARRFGVSRALPYMIVFGMGLARLALDAAAQPTIVARAGEGALIGVMVAGLALGVIGDAALVRVLYSSRPEGQPRVLDFRPQSRSSHPRHSPPVLILPLSVTLVYAAVPPELPSRIPPLFDVLGIAMIVVGALVPVFTVLPGAISDCRAIRAAKRARTTP